MLEALGLLFRQRRLLSATVVQALRARFSGNVFGAAWLLLYPLVFLSLYSLVFIFILGVRVPGLGTMDYVLVDVVVGHASMGLGMLFTWLATVYFGHLHWSHLAVPVIYAFQILMAIGLVWISATICVFFRDLQQAIPIIVLFLMLVSPIGYTDEMVPVDMRAILQVNPLAWLMHLYRACLIDGVLPVGDLVVFGLLSLVMLSVGHVLITRLKPLFSDYV